MAEKEWLSAQEASKLSGYHLETIRRLVREGKIGAEKFTFVWMISRASLLEYLDQAHHSGDTRFGPKGHRRNPLDS